MAAIMRKRGSWRLAFSSLAAAVCAISAAAAEDRATTIKITLSMSVERISPNPTTGIATHAYTIVLSGGNQVNEHYVGGGKHVLDINRTATMGQAGADRYVQYRVVDANTIEMIRTYPSYTSVITIFVTGKTCHITHKATLNPGHTEFTAYSQELGVMATYKYFKLADSTCEIS